MKRKLIYSAATLMALASPIFAQTPGASGGGSDSEASRCLYRHGHRRPAFAAWAKGKLARFGLRSLARNPGAAGGHPVRTHFRTGAH